MAPRRAGCDTDPVVLLTDETRVKLFMLLQRPIGWGLKLLGDPVSLISDTDRLVRDPYGTYDTLRQDGPVVTSRLPLVAVATGHEVIRTVLREGHVQPAPGSQVQWDSPLDPSLLSLDPPDHTRIRKLVAQAFTPRAVARMRTRAHDVAEGLLDDAEARGGTIDLMRDYASVLPITLICALLGITPEDVPAGPGESGLDTLRRWGSDVALSLEMPDPRTKPQIDRAGAEMARFFSDVYEQRRADPGEDVLSALVAARAEADDAGGTSDRLSDRELIATSILILLAGFETTVNLIGNGTLALLHHPEQRESFVADPAGLAPTAVEEILRYDSPVQMTSRMLPAERNLGGLSLRAGTAVICLLGAANRDPAVFATPDRLDLTRTNAKEHLSFSSGAHFCLGASLARLEGEVALARLFARFPKLEQAAPARRRRTQVLRGLETFPVRLGPS